MIGSSACWKSAVLAMTIVGELYHGDALDVLPRLPPAFARLIYVDPPFNTGKLQKRDRIAVSSDPEGQRVGFGGKRYRSSSRGASPAYADRRDDYVPWLLERLKACLRCATEDASLFVHLDPREAHYVKVALDELLGRANFMNEIVWAYDYGGRSKKRWPAKHDVILWYARQRSRYAFDYDAMDRIPYMAPGLVSAEKSSARQDPHRRVVAHHRSHPRRRKDRLSHAEAARSAGANHQGPLRAGRHGARLFRR